jgi:hypothetical protein
MPWLIAEHWDDSPAPDARRAPRHRLRLETAASASGSTTQVVMLDLSETGMMISTQAGLAVDEILQVELPEAGMVEARVAWKRMSLYGCLFLAPVARAAISAVRLKSEPQSSGS